MRKIYTTQRLLGVAAATAALCLAAPTAAQDNGPEVVEEQELFQDDAPD